jgi:phosphinothricin acetyltransferase
MPAGFSVRPAEERDFPVIAAIYGDAVLHGIASYEVEPPPVAEMMRRWSDVTAKGLPYLVAENGSVLGYAYAGPHHARPAYRFAVDDSVYVSPAAHRRGIGKALLTKVIATCEAQGYRQMVAVIGGGAENTGSVTLHERLGFRRIGVIEGAGFKHGRWLDTTLMQRALGPGKSTRPESG